MDWFLYDKELRHERVKDVSRLLRLNSKVHRILLNHLVLFFGIYCVSVKQNKTKLRTKHSWLARDNSKPMLR